MQHPQSSDTSNLLLRLASCNIKCAIQCRIPPDASKMLGAKSNSTSLVISEESNEVGHDDDLDNHFEAIHRL